MTDKPRKTGTKPTGSRTSQPGSTASKGNTGWQQGVDPAALEETSASTPESSSDRSYGGYTPSSSGSDTGYSGGGSGGSDNSGGGGGTTD